MALIKGTKDKRQSFLTCVKACLLNTIPRVIPSYPQNPDFKTVPFKDSLTAPHQTIHKHKGRPRATFMFVNKLHNGLIGHFCAGRENRTLISSLARTCPTTKRYPQQRTIYTKPRKTQNIEPPSACSHAIFVLSEGFEPPTTVPKTVVISISPREQYLQYTLIHAKIKKIE